MYTQSIFAFFVAIIVLGLSPGPAVFGAISRGLTMPLKRVYWFIAGVLVADALNILMALLGLAILAQTFSMAFTALKIVGGFYLIYLGVKSWSSSSNMQLVDQHEESASQLFLSGLLVNGANPKGLVFFVGFLPLFIDMNTLSTASIARLILIALVGFAITQSIYAVGAAYIKRWFQRDHAIMYLHRVAGVMIAGVGIAVMFR